MHWNPRLWLRDSNPVPASWYQSFENASICHEPNIGVESKIYEKYSNAVMSSVALAYRKKFPALFVPMKDFDVLLGILVLLVGFSLGSMLTISTNPIFASTDGGEETGGDGGGDGGGEETGGDGGGDDEINEICDNNQDDDGDGLVDAVDTDSCPSNLQIVDPRIQIPPPNTPPIAKISGDTVLNYDESIILDGGASNDPDGGPIVSYNWETAGGCPGARINDAASPAPEISFVNPRGGDFGIKLTVTDDENSQGSEGITIRAMRSGETDESQSCPPLTYFGSNIPTPGSGRDFVASNPAERLPGSAGGGTPPNNGGGGTPPNNGGGGTPPNNGGPTGTRPGTFTLGPSLPLTPQGAPSQQQYQIYQNDSKNLRIQYPQSWNPEEGPDSVTFQSPIESSSVGSRRPSEF